MSNKNDGKLGVTECEETEWKHYFCCGTTYTHSIGLIQNQSCFWEDKEERKTAVDMLLWEAQWVGVGGTDLLVKPPQC